MQMLSALPWTATSESCLFVCLGWCSPGLNVGTPSEVEYLNTLVFMYVGWLNRCRKSKNRQRDGSRDIEGQMKRHMIGVGGLLLFSALCMWLLCNYCRFSVSTVLLHYMKDSYLLCPEGAFLSLSYTISGIKESKSIPAYVLNSI